MADEFDPSQPFTTDEGADEFDPSQPFTAADDQGPPLSGKGAPDDAPSRWKGLLDRVKSFGAGAAMNFGDEASGALGAVAEKMAAKAGWVDDRPIGEMYREGRDFARKELGQAQADHPGMSVLGGITSGIPMAAALPGGIAAKGGQMLAQGAIQGGIAGLGGSEADDAAGMAWDATKGVGMGLAASYLVPKVGAAIAAPAKAAAVKVGAGKLLQLPQQAMEAVAERVGRTGIAKSIAGRADTPGAGSAAAKALRNIVDSASMGDSKLASATQEAVEKLGQKADQLVASMDSVDLDDVAKAMSEMLGKRGAKEATPEFVRANMDAIAAAGGLDLNEASAKQLIRIVNKRDIAYQVRALANTGDFWDKAFGGDKYAAKVRDLLVRNKGVLGDINGEAIDRLGRPGSPVGQRGQFFVSEMDSALARNAKPAAPMGTTATDLPMSEWASSGRPEDALPVFGTDSMQDAAGGAVQAATKKLAPKSSAATTVAPPQLAPGSFDPTLMTRAPQAPTMDAQQASEKLRNIATGRAFMDKANAVLGLFGGIAIGGPGGIVAGASLGLGSRAADIAGDFGQYFAQKGKAEIAEATLKAAANPAGLRKLALRQDQIGSLARWAMEGGANQTARMFVLQMQPEFRKAVTDDAERQEEGFDLAAGAGGF